MNITQIPLFVLCLLFFLPNNFFKTTDQTILDFLWCKKAPGIFKSTLQKCNPASDNCNKCYAPSCKLTDMLCCCSLLNNVWQDYFATMWKIIFNHLHQVRINSWHHDTDYFLHLFLTHYTTFLIRSSSINMYTWHMHAYKTSNKQFPSDSFSWLKKTWMDEGWNISPTKNPRSSWPESTFWK